MKSNWKLKIDAALRNKLPSNGKTFFLALCLASLCLEQNSVLGFSQDGTPTSIVPSSTMNSTDADADAAARDNATAMPQDGDNKSVEPKMEIFSQPAAAPALNIVATPARPPIPPPPQDVDLPSVDARAVPPEAWRVRANQLFKPNSIDKSTLSQIVLTSSYKNSLKALREAFASQGFTVEAVSANAGHMLITYRTTRENRPVVEKAIFALRKTAKQTSEKQFISPTNDGSSAPQAGTEIRCVCDGKNKTLTTAKVKEILNSLQAGAPGADPGQAY